ICQAELQTAVHSTRCPCARTEVYSSQQPNTSIHPPAVMPLRRLLDLS
uniref:Uncharacterized protein n=1 Tax=Aegilops tauschii subsp. strangulata TaxID=200361 RepID=A0A453JMU4_AEGTS